MPPFQESPRCRSPFQRKPFSQHCLDFHAEDPLTPWWHVGQPCEKASRESHRSLDRRDGKRRHAAQERREELMGRATIPRVPQMSQSIPEDPVLPALLQLSRRELTHTTVARVTNLWESLVGKPRGKATDPLIHATGSVTLLLQHGRKAHVHAPTRDENSLPWGDSRNTPRCMSALERNPQVPAPTPHKVLGPGIDGRGIATGPLATRMGTGLS